MKLKVLIIFILSTSLLCCDKKVPDSNQEEATLLFQNKGHELVYKMTQKIGDYNALRNKKDVIYTYTYQTPDGKADISTEKYIFDGELSYGLYRQHERTFPDLEGQIEQGYDGNDYWLKHNNQIINDSTRLKRVAFNRPTNFYWFAMMQKLLDPGLNYEYLGEKKIRDKMYDIVKVSFISETEKPTDIYQLYINQNTLLVDQFLFTVADFGVIETPFLMTLNYKNIEGLWIPYERLYKKSDWNATIDENPWIEVTWSNIQFNNNLTLKDFEK